MERNRQDAGALCGTREPDHGTWSVLVKMFPKANLPVFQLSLDYGTDLKAHYELAKELSYLRQKGVLIS